MKGKKIKTTLLIAVFILSTLTALPLIAPAEAAPPETNDWPMYRGNLAHTGVAYPTLKGIIDPVELWSFDAIGRVRGSPVLADLDSDGHLEVIICDDDGKVTKFSHTGTKLEEYEAVEEVFMGTPSVADIDDTAGLEVVVVAQSGEVYVLDKDLNELYTASSADLDMQSLQIVDVDDDTDLEILVPTSAGLYIFEKDLTSEVHGSFPVCRYTTPSVADVDDDGDLDIVFVGDVGAGDLKVVAFEDASDVASDTTLWDFGLTDAMDYTGLAVADIDDDGFNEVVVTSRSDAVVYAIDGDGSQLWSQDLKDVGAGAEYIDSAPAIGDVEGDGGLEVVIGTDTYNDDTGLIFFLDGLTGTEIRRSGDVDSVYNDPALVDVDLDGYLDVVFVGSEKTVNEGKLRVVSGEDASILWSWTLTDDSDGDPAVADINGDGMMDIVVVDTSGFVFALSGYELTLDKDYYHTGETVIATVTDFTKNTDPMAIETVTITAVSLTDAVGDEITLTETGAGDTGIFQGYIHLIPEPPANREADEIVVSDDDTITVTYEHAVSHVKTATAIVDDTDPIVEITAPLDEAFVLGSVDIITDIIEANQDTVSIKIDGEEVAAISTYTWDTEAEEAEVRLWPDGPHIIEVLVIDKIGNIGSDSITVYVDNTEPSVTDEEATPRTIEPDIAATIVFTASVVDEVSGVESVVIDVSEIDTGTLDMLDDGVDPDVTEGDGIYTASFATTGLSEDTYMLVITATDGVGLTGEATISLVVSTDIESPVITDAEITYPIGVFSARIGDPLIISATVTDNIGVASVIVSDDLTEHLIDEAMTEDEGIYTLDLADLDPADLPEYLPGTYELTITALDANGNEATEIVLLEVTKTLTGYNIPLDEGLNLMSLPLIPDDESIEVVLSEISGDVESVWSYDATTGDWLFYQPEFQVGDLEEMEDGNGYWMKMTNPATLAVSGLEVPEPPLTPPTYDVVEGWNLIGFKETTEMGADEYLLGIAEQYVTIWQFIDGEYDRLDLTGNMFPGRGYWLAVTEPGTIYP